MIFAFMKRTIISFTLIAALFGTPAMAETRTVPADRTQVTLSFAPVVRQVAPAVVNIYAKVVRKRRAQSLFDDPFFRRFFGERIPRGRTRKRMQKSLGSGVIVGKKGIVVTNHHVIKNAQQIKVVLSDRREFDAKVLLNDKKTDLAVLRIQAGKDQLPTVSFGDADKLEVGDLVIAIGNPFGVGQTVTSGIVSALARTNVGVSDFRSFIQTDAAINPGNSGGALVNLKGQLIGINTAIFSRKGGGSVGIGFAVPSTMVRTVVESAVSGKPLIRPWLSLTGTAVTADMAEGLGLERPTGVLVESVYPKGPAEKAGIRRGDVITHIGSFAVEDEYALRFRLAARPIGESAGLTYLRRGNTNQANFKLIAPPEVPPRNATVIKGRNPFSGLKVVNLSPAVIEKHGIRTSGKGVLVVAVKRGSPAIRVGFKPGDIFLNINGTSIKRVEDFKRALKIGGQPWEVNIRRGKKTRRFRIG
ncbi:MAG TPA: serine protease [Rhodospirillaceae bacterium]|nr:serine protease [Rhodospirillaceae bacterium]